MAAVWGGARQLSSAQSRKLTLLRASAQAAAGMGIYGPRTVYVIALKDAPGCHEFLLQDDGKWLHVKETTEIGEPPTPQHDLHGILDRTSGTALGCVHVACVACACAGSPRECMQPVVNVAGTHVWP